MKRGFLEKRKKAVSPVIATVLLIAMVVVIALIVFLWFRGLTQEAVTKFGGTNVELVCGDVQFSSSLSSSNVLSISNIGNVPIYSMKLEVLTSGSTQTFDLGESYPSAWPENGLLQGGIFSSSVSEVSGADEVLLIPVLIGSSSGGQKTHVCDDRFGQELI